MIAAIGAQIVWGLTWLLRSQTGRSVGLTLLGVGAFVGAMWWWTDSAGDRREAEIEAARNRQHIEALHRLREIEEETRNATDDDLRRELGILDGLR